MDVTQLYSFITAIFGTIAVVVAFVKGGLGNIRVMQESYTQFLLDAERQVARLKQEAKEELTEVHASYKKEIDMMRGEISMLRELLEGYKEKCMGCMNQNQKTNG